jgi:drug/metabolite transporter (DMT)-like permease
MNSIIDKKNILDRPSIIFLLTLFCALMWGSAYPCIKIGYKMLGIENDNSGIIYFAAFRFFIAGLILFAGMLIAGRKITLPEKKDYRFVLIYSIGFTTVPYLLFYIGIAKTSAVNASIVNGSWSFFAVILAHFFMGDDSLNIKKGIGLVFGFLGLLFVNINNELAQWNTALIGDGMILLSALVAAIGGLVLKRKLNRINPILLTAYPLLLCSFSLFVYASLFDTGTRLHFNPASILLLFYLSFISAIAFVIWNVLLKYNKLSTLAVYQFLIPVIGSILSIMMLASEQFTITTIIALIMVSIGIIVINKSARIEI